MDESTHRICVVYLIRHGEALHNTKEKLAMDLAMKAAMAEGLCQEEVDRRVEDARVGCLKDDALFDAPLSEKGKEEAEGARRTVKSLEASGLPPPTYCLVSPLQRAMQTANIIFPDIADIHVRDELKERQTGYACDSRQCTESLKTRSSFKRFSMLHLKRSSFVNSLRWELRDSRRSSSSMDDTINEKDAKDRVEQRPMLRARTSQLFPLLRDCGHQVAAVVTHKGYLRELERGPFGFEDAAPFQNCEVRVYKVRFVSGSYVLESAERIA